MNPLTIVFVIVLCFYFLISCLMFGSHYLIYPELSRAICPEAPLFSLASSCCWSCTSKLVFLLSKIDLCIER